jgi:hypothetical protein
MKKQMTVRDLRKVLVWSEKFAIVNTFELTNREARNLFADFDNQDKIVNVFENENCVSVWYL